MKIDELEKIIYKAGVVGAGGAGFPTHRKLSPNVDTVIVNAAECEPLLKVDRHLMEAHMEELWHTLDIVVEAVGARQGYIAIKSKNIKYVDNIYEMAEKYPKLAVKELRDIYPAGDEVVLTYEVTGRIVPEAGIPLAVGVMVINVETLLNISRALEGLPVTHKYITIAGEVAHPVTVCAPIGMPFGEVLKEAGCSVAEGYEVIAGGPLMGRICNPRNEVVSKTTKGIIVLPSNHPLIRKKKLTPDTAVRRASSACCQCRACTDMCPRYLLGHGIEIHKTVRSVVNDITDDAVPYLKAQLCSACGVCEYFSCTQDVMPRTICAEVKSQTLKNGLKYKGGYTPCRARDEREHRLVSSKRIIARCGLSKYDRDSGMLDRVLDCREVRIGLRQHIGKAAVPKVAPGDLVEMGQLIASVGEEEMGANVHASIRGKVYQLTSDYIIIRKEA